MVECKPGSDAVWATKHWPWQRITTVINMKGNASALICTAHSHGVAVLVNVQPAAVAAFGGWVNYTNDLANASSRERAAITIAASTHLSGYDGVVLDIESNDPRNRDALSSFAATVRARLRERGGADAGAERAAAVGDQEDTNTQLDNIIHTRRIRSADS